jgi:hypothetical protein
MNITERAATVLQEINAALALAEKATANLSFVFDVESIGLHGEPFAVGWTVIDSVGAEIDFGRIAIPPEMAHGDDDDSEWCRANIPAIPATHMSMKAMLVDFWSQWMKWKEKGALMFAECAWPVEAKFLAMCIGVDYPRNKWEGPYPFHDVASVMLSSGMNPMANYERTESEMPKHCPLADARQSARLLCTARTARPTALRMLKTAIEVLSKAHSEQEQGFLSVMREMRLEQGIAQDNKPYESQFSLALTTLINQWNENK